MSNFGRHFQVVFDNSPVGMAILDSEGRFLYTNRALQRMFGYSKDELHARPFFEFLLPDDTEELTSQFAKIVEKENSHVRSESRYLPRDQHEAWARFYVSHVSEGGHSPYIFALIEDITSTKLDQKQLMQAKEVAEKATRTKSEFLANMSHEIRTPIHTIIGMSELMMETSLDDEQEEYTDQVRFSADVLLSLVNDILDFSKIEAGKLTLEYIDFDLYTLVEEAVDLVSLEAHKKGLDVCVYIPPRMPRFVKGDPVRLRQIIMNLFNNAVKFTRQGQIILYGEVVEEKEYAHRLKFSVEDSGIGIPKEKLDVLFKAFSQVDSSTTRKFGGTGLGLSISKSLAGMMNGTVDVFSEGEGKGATFSFTIELDQPDEPKTVEEPDLRCEDYSILIVEDNERARGLLKQYLRDFGCKGAREAEHGGKALELLMDAATQRKPYDIALIDLTLPEMDGWRLASEINSDRRINATKLILMNPAGKSEEAKMKLLKWFDGYLAKPIKRDELIEVLDTVMHTETDLLPVEEDAAEEVEELEEVEEISQEIAEETGAAASSKAASGAQPGPSADTPKGVFLIAEDHEINQQLFQTILEKMGYKVELAANGREAVEKVREQQLDLIFMDVQMPEMNGYEAAGKIREEGYRVPIVAVTANALKGEAEKCLEAGMDDYLTKPFKKQDLSPLIEKWSGAESEKAAGHPKPQAVAAEEAEQKESDAVQVQKPEPEQNAGPPPLDFDLAVETFMGREEVVIRVLENFIEKVRGQIHTMRDALQKRELETLRNEAHAIKGGAWNIQAKPLGDAAYALETSAREEDVNQSIDNLKKLVNVFKEFREAVLEELERRK